MDKISLDQLTDQHDVYFRHDKLVEDGDHHVRHGHFVRRIDESTVALFVQDPPMGPPAEWPVAIADILEVKPISVEQPIIVYSDRFAGETPRELQERARALVAQAVGNTAVVAPVSELDNMHSRDLVSHARNLIGTRTMSTVVHQTILALAARVEALSEGVEAPSVMLETPRSTPPATP